MKIYDLPAQARGLREIEAAAASLATRVIKEVECDVQSVQTKEEKKEERPEEEAESPTKKARSKKNTKKI